jgi:hypothetical protein
MKQSYCPRQCWMLSGVVVVMAFLYVSAASAQTPSIEGTYQLVLRKLPDGPMLKPPDILGLCTFTKSHRNFNFVLKDATGKFFSFSVVSTYTLTATEYSETLLFSIRTDQIGGKDIVYDLSGQTRSTPVTVEGGRIQFKHPFDPRLFVFEGNTWTSTREDKTNVDVWEKVQ